MLTLVDRYLIRRLSFTSFIVVLAMSGPVILVALFVHLPERAFFSSLLWPILYGFTCTILYHAMPVLVAVGIVWSYARFTSEGVLVTLYASGRSMLATKKPALIVALAATIVGYGISLFLSPHSSRHIHDVLYSLRHDINPELLQPGAFNQTGTNAQVIYFDNRASDTELDNVFIREVNAKNEERVYVARKAVFKREAGTKYVALLDGSLQVFDRNTAEVRTVAFDQFIWPGSRSGEIVRERKRIHSDEIATPEFLQSYARTHGDPVWSRRWTQEATKRFGIPLLALIHTLLGLELLALLGTMTDRQRQPVALICATLLAIHVAIVVGSEQIWRYDAWMGLGIAGLMAAELALALGLMLHRWHGGAQQLRARAAAAASMLTPPAFPVARECPAPSRTAV